MTTIGQTNPEQLSTLFATVGERLLSERKEREKKGLVFPKVTQGCDKCDSPTVWNDFGVGIQGIGVMECTICGAIHNYFSKILPPIADFDVSLLQKKEKGIDLLVPNYLNLRFSLEMI